jgi:nucleoside-diphosphate-sugar epimerase
MSARTVLVTGATGFVGSHVVRRCVDDGNDVHVLCRVGADTTRLADVRGRITVHDGDVCEAGEVRALVDRVQPQRVYHLAAATMHGGRAPSTDEQLRTNLGGTITLMDACAAARVEAFVNVGDAFEYGPRSGPAAEDTPCRPVSVDGMTKYAATLYGQALAASHGVPVITVRAFSIVGPADDPRRLVPRLVDAARTRGRLALSDHRIVRDFVWVDDVVELLVRAADRAVPMRGTVVNCGSGMATSLGDLVDVVERVSGTRDVADWNAYPVAAHDLEHPIADVRLARSRFGWNPSIAFREMIERLWTDARRRQPSERPA